MEGSLITGITVYSKGTKFIFFINRKLEFHMQCSQLMQFATVEPVLKDHPIDHANVISKAFCDRFNYMEL